MRWVVLIAREQATGRMWEEVARVDADSRPDAWEQAKAAVPSLVPATVTEDRELQIVPARAWEPIVSRVEQQPPVSVVEGLT